MFVFFYEKHKNIGAIACDDCNPQPEQCTCTGTDQILSILQVNEKQIIDTTEAVCKNIQDLASQTEQSAETELQQNPNLNREQQAQVTEIIVISRVANDYVTVLLPMNEFLRYEFNELVTILLDPKFNENIAADTVKELSILPDALDGLIEIGNDHISILDRLQNVLGNCVSDELICSITDLIRALQDLCTNIGKGKDVLLTIINLLNAIECN